MNRLWRAALICAILFCCLANILSAQNREYRIKAEFLERFTRFVDWPEDGESNDSASFHLCVLGDNPFGTYLADLTGEVRIRSRRVKVTNFKELRNIPTCDLLFIDHSQSANLSTILSITSQRPILTIGDSDGFAEKGVLINFYKEKDFIRFEINKSAVQNSGLRFSSRLLKLARLVD